VTEDSPAAKAPVALRDDDVMMVTGLDRLPRTTADLASQYPDYHHVRLGRPPKMTQHQAKDAPRRRDNGEPMRHLARSSTVSHSTMSRIACATAEASGNGILTD
jgi:DNA invertase Pin-like site-specific DNA recombinase